MAAIFSFKCTCCDEIHEGSPSFSFSAPAPYIEQSDEIKAQGHLGTDTCWYEDEEGPHFFIRTCLEIPIHGVEDPFIWGVWVSLSETSYDRYIQTYDSPDESDSYFGWFCNYLPYYPKTYALKTSVHPRLNGTRPYIELEANEHPLSQNFHQGISIAKAQEIAEIAMHQ